MKELKVDILTVGDDWKDKYVEGIEYMKKHGKVVFLPYTKGISTTLLKERIICRNNRSKKNKFLIGKKTYLRPIEQVDLEGNWYTWFNDPDVTKHMKHGVFPNTYEKQKAFLERILDSTEMIQLAIIDRKTDKFIGVVSIREIDWVTRSGGIRAMGLRPWRYSFIMGSQK
jgi:RimJ/RimL family protein N-acetyltransferase